MLKQCQKFSSKSFKDPSELTNSTLKLIHVIFRHGNRTPAAHAYKDDVQETGYKPYGPGQLTNAGKETMYKLGQFIRQNYNNFLGEYFPGVIQARTTCVDRTQCSLQLFLAGLYPPRNKLVWDPALLWQPIPYITTNIEHDSILQAFTFNPNYKIAYREYQKKFNFRKKNLDLVKYIEKHSKKKIETIKDVWLLYFQLIMQVELGIEIPEWTKKIFPNPMEEIASTYYVHTCATSQLRTLVLKPLTDKIIHDTKSKLEKKDAAVLMYVYSGHEVNIAHTLIALNSFKPTHIPQYGSCVILEVHQFDDEVYIKGLYKLANKPYTILLQLWNKNPLEFKEFVENIDANYK
nr:venom acid phosphatase Acph-1-like isoform X1 [Onthophagus taurus]